MDLIEEKDISTKWRVALAITIVPLIFFEIIRCYQRFQLSDMIGPWIVALSCAIVTSLILVLFFVLAGKRRAPFYLSFPLFFNLFTLTVIPYALVDSIRVTREMLFGFPDWLYYLYLLDQLVLVVMLVTYYFTEYLFGYRAVKMQTQREKDFDAFLKEPDTKTGKQ